MDSILTSIKKLIGISEEDTNFDVDIIIHINSTFMTLKQLGVGPTSGFSIADKSATWNDFLGEQADDVEAVKTYVYIKVRLVFDPPSNSTLVEALKTTADELEWRLNVQVETF